MLEDFGREGGNAGEVDGLEQSVIDLSGQILPLSTLVASCLHTRFDHRVGI